MGTGGKIKTPVIDSLNTLRGESCKSAGCGNSLRQRILALTFLIIIASGVCWYNYSLHFNGFLRNDNHEYCQIARNFYEGNGYSTSVLRPIAYKFFQTLPQPEVMRMPVYPFILSLFFHVFGPADITVVLFNSLFYVALVALTFLVALELSGNIFVSLITALATAAMKAFYRDTITAEPNIFYASLFLVFIYFYMKFPRKLLLHGIFLAVLYLVRANTLFVFAGVLIAAGVGNKSWGKRINDSLILTGGFALGLIPYMIRNYAVIGKPFFSLYKYSLLLLTKGFPRYTAWTIIPDIDPTAYALEHPAEMIQKSVNFFFSLIGDFFLVYKPFFLIVTAIGFFLSLNNPDAKKLKIIIVAGFITQTVMLLPIGPVAYYYLFFFPLIIAIAASGVQEHLKKYAPPVLLAVLAVFLYTSVSYWKSPRQANPFPAIGKQVAELTGKDDIILTDIPWETTWYSNRRTIWLTYDLETLAVISRTLKPKYILVAGYSYAPYKDNVWGQLVQSPDFAEKIGYQFKSSVTFGNRPVAMLFKSIDIDKNIDKNKEPASGSSGDTKVRR